MPSAVFGFADGRMNIYPGNWSANPWPTNASISNPAEVVERRHDGTVNVMYLDGHVGGRNVLVLPNATTPEGKLFWHGRNN
jgi:prepilin-type processing-associated H-X9-DG protein